MEPIKIKENVYVNLLEYNGKYRIEQGNVGEGGKWWADRVVPLKWDKDLRKRVPADKEGNVKIQLGERRIAIGILTDMLAELTREPDVQDSIPDTDAPF